MLKSERFPIENIYVPIKRRATPDRARWGRKPLSPQDGQLLPFLFGMVFPCALAAQRKVASIRGG